MSSGRQSVVRGSALTDRMRKDLDLIRRHVTLLEVVEERQPIGIIRLAKLAGYPQHHIRYTLRILEQEGLVRPSQKGAVTTARAKRFREKLRVLLEEMKGTVESLKESP
jgi:predicted transcriptional regulator